MAKVLLVEKAKKVGGKDKEPRKFSTEQSLAEKMLRKSKGWELPKDSPFVFKDNALTEKAKKQA